MGTHPPSPGEQVPCPKESTPCHTESITHLLALLHKSELEDFTLKAEPNLPFGVDGLNVVSDEIVSYGLSENVHDLALRLVRLAGAGLLGLRSFFNRSLIQITLGRKILIDGSLVTDAIATGLAEHFRWNHYCALHAVLVSESVFEITRIHASSFKKEMLKQSCWGGPIAPPPLGDSSTRSWRWQHRSSSRARCAQHGPPCQGSGEQRSSSERWHRTQRRAPCWWRAQSCLRGRCRRPHGRPQPRGWSSACGDERPHARAGRSSSRRRRRSRDHRRAGWRCGRRGPSGWSWSRSLQFSFSGTRVPVVGTSPFWLVLFWGGHPLCPSLYLLYHIFCYSVKYFFLSLLTFFFFFDSSSYDPFILFSPFPLFL